VRTLSVIGVEDGTILAADENGERFRIPVDESVRGRLAVSSLPPGKRLSPREIQAQVRAGLSVEEVASRAGVPAAHVERFVRPVLAERSFVLQSAMRVVVQPDANPDQASSFGAVMAERLTALDATDVSWTSLREAGGDWIVCVAFRADEVDHRARWTFDAKRLVLEPENFEASTLSQQGTPAALTPRLRVLPPTGPVAVPETAAAELPVEDAKEPDRSRFDSAIFELPDLEAGAPQQGPVEASVLLDALARKRVERETLTPESATVAQAAAPVTAPVTAAAAVTAVVDSAPTADTVEVQGTVTRGRFPEQAPEPEAEAEADYVAINDAETQVLTPLAPTADIAPADVVPQQRPRERGRRPEQQPRSEPAQRPQAQQAPRPQAPRQQPSKVRQAQSAQGRLSQARHVDMDAAPARPVAVPPPGQPRARRGRTSLPSWDEIVFGKSDD
jgi:Protein of unknown function (DUF3071)